MSILGAFALPHPPIILPEIGKGEEVEVQKTIDAYHTLARKIATLKPEVIIISSPHSVCYGDYFHISPSKYAGGSMKKFGAPQVVFNIEQDYELAESIVDYCKDENIDAGFLGGSGAELDHGVTVPLYFINKYYQDFKLVRIGLSGLPLATHYKLGTTIAKAVSDTNKKAVFIASGDLSHKCTIDGPYGYSAEGVAFDKKIVEALANGDFYTFLQISKAERETASECGLGSYAIMAGSLDGKEVQAKLLSYQNNLGVGYAIASFLPTHKDSGRYFLAKYMAEQKQILAAERKAESPYTALARYSAEYFVKYKKRAKLPATLEKELLENKSGVFVTLHKDGELRGCIGTITPTKKNIATEILHNAVSACSADPRFQPVEEWELDNLSYSVDVLCEAEQIAGIDMLDVKKYGVIVASGKRQGLLLPNLDGVDTPEEQIAIALSKAGIDSSEPYKLMRFEVVRYK